MKKRIYCTNCGAMVGENEEKCPYCGMINPTGAEAAHMRRLQGIRREMEDMEDDVGEAYVRELKKKGSRAVKIAAAVVMLLILLVLLPAAVHMVEKNKSERQMKEEIAFEKKYLPELERIYAAGDDDATLEYLNSISGEDGAAALFGWRHHDYFNRYATYKEMQAVREKTAEGSQPDEGRVNYLVRRILAEERAEYMSLDYAVVTEEEREKILAWQEEKSNFLRRDLSLSEEELDKIWEN